MGKSHISQILLHKAEGKDDQKRGKVRVQRKGGDSRKVSSKLGRECVALLEGRTGFTPVKTEGGEHSRS